MCPFSHHADQCRTSTSQTKSATRSRFDVSSTTDKSCEQAPFWRLNMVKAMGDRAEAVPALFALFPPSGPIPTWVPGYVWLSVMAGDFILYFALRVALQTLADGLSIFVSYVQITTMIIRAWPVDARKCACSPYSPYALRTAALFDRGRLKTNLVTWLFKQDGGLLARESFSWCLAYLCLFMYSDILPEA